MCNLDRMDIICIVNNILEFVGRVGGRDKREEWELFVCCESKPVNDFQNFTG